MTVNALGSLCSKLCEQFTWNCQCNRSNISCCNKTTTYYLGTSLEPSVAAIIKQQNLPEAMQALEKKPIPVCKIKTSANLSQVVEDHGIESVRAGMCKKMLELIARLKVEGEEKGNGQSKLKLAGVITNFQGIEKYTNGEPLTKKEYSTLKKAAKNVQKYYKGAIYLWLEVCRFNFKYSQIKDEMLKVPLEYFKQKVSILSKTNLKEEKSFWNLQKIAKIIFLEASMKFKPNQLKVIEAKPELQAALFSPNRGRIGSEDSDFPKILLESEVRHHRPGQSYDAGSLEPMTENDEKAIYSPKNKNDTSPTQERTGMTATPESPVDKDDSSANGEDSPLVLV